MSKSTGRRSVKGQGARPAKWRDRWRAYLTVGYDKNGKPIRLYVYGKTAQECQQALNALIRQREEGGLSGDERPPALKVWLERWLTEKARVVKPRTIAIYREDLGHVPERLLKRRIDTITPLQVQGALSSVADDVSARASRAVRKILHAAFRDAMRLGVIARNPVAAVPGVAYKPKPPKVWSAAEVVRFLNSRAGRRSWYYPFFYAALSTGARVGELYALQWGDLSGETLRIERTSSGQGKDRTIGPPKTRSGRRSVPVSPDLAEVLQGHKRTLALRGFPVDDKALMFPSEDGTLLTYRNTRRALIDYAERAEVPVIRPHDLRHTYASMAIAAGMTPADLARQLGHKDASFTLRQYVHFFERATPREALSLSELTGLDLASGNPIGGILGGTEPGEPS